MTRKEHKNWKITRRGNKYHGIGKEGTENEGFQFGPEEGPHAANSPRELRIRINADPDTPK